jgi:hypothetical protein
MVAFCVNPGSLATSNVSITRPAAGTEGFSAMSVTGKTIKPGADDAKTAALFAGETGVAIKRTAGAEEAVVMLADETVEGAVGDR